MANSDNAIITKEDSQIEDKEKRESEPYLHLPRSTGQIHKLKFTKERKGEREWVRERVIERRERYPTSTGPALGDILAAGQIHKVEREKEQKR